MPAAWVATKVLLGLAELTPTALTWEMARLVVFKSFQVLVLSSFQLPPPPMVPWKTPANPPLGSAYAAYRLMPPVKKPAPTAEILIDPALPTCGKSVVVVSPSCFPSPMFQTGWAESGLTVKYTALAF